MKLGEKLDDSLPTSLIDTTALALPTSMDLGLYRDLANKAQVTADVIEITDDSEASLATDSLSKIKSNIKQLETYRKEIVNPANNFVDFVNGKFKPISESMKGAASVIDRKIVGYADEKEKRRQAEEAKRLAEFNKKVAAEQKRAERTGQEAKIIAPPVTLLVESQVRGESGVTSIKKAWDYEVIDIALLYKMRPDLVSLEVKRRATLEAIEKDQTIQGLRIFQTSRTATR